MNKLYIIGNGFDIAHNLKTRYSDFRCYLNDNEPEFLADFEKLFGFYLTGADEHLEFKNDQETDDMQRNAATHELLWKNFEISLGQPNEGEIESICFSAVKSMSDIKFGVIGNTLDYYFEEQFSFVQELQKHLLTWVNSIALNNVKIIKGSLINDSSDFFLTFNYTSVLEQVYNICSDRICHIHGGLFPYCYITPVIGHGNHKPIEQRQQWKKECDEQFDEVNIPHKNER